MTFPDLASLQNSCVHPAAGQSGGINVSEILNQILLPIVLILAYLAGGPPPPAATGNDRLRQEVTDTKKQLAEAYLQLQQQKIVAALEKVEAARKQELGLYYLTNKTLQVTPAGGLGDQDPTVATSCISLQSVLRTDDNRAAESQRLFDRVLGESGLTAAPPSAPAPQAGADPVGESLILTPGNRTFLSEKIQVFLQNLEAETLREQGRLIDDVFRQYRDMPLDERYRIVPETRGIEQQIADLNKQGKDITALADGLAQAIYRKVRQDFESQSYLLLDRAWSTR